MPTNPVIANGATLALRNASGDNTLPAVINIPSGTLEGVPGAFGDAATPLNLTGGTLRLSALGDGLNARIYNQTPPNVNNQVPDFNAFGSYTSFFAALPAPNISVLTSFNGVTGLDYQGTPQYGIYGATFDDNIISRMFGQIFIPTAGAYTFGTSSDDGSVVFIDGSLVTSNNFYQGRTRREGSVTLTAGTHNIDIGFYEGGGGNSFTVDWAGPNFAAMVLPNNVLFSGSQVATFNNPIDVQQNSTIDVAAANTVVQSLTLQTGRTLTVTGETLTAPTVTLNGAGSYGFSGNGTIVATNLLDNGADVDIVKSGTGVLVLDNTTTPQLQNAGSSVTVTGGQVGLLLDSNNPNPNLRRNPLGNASITFAGGGLVLSSKGGNQTFALPVFNGDGAVIARQVGSGVAGPVNITLTGSLGVAAGQTVTLGTDNGYTIDLGGAATGSGNVVITGTGVRANTNTALQGLNVNVGAGAAASLLVNANSPLLGSLKGATSSSVIVGTGAGPALLTLGGGSDARFNGVLSEQTGTTLSLLKVGPNRQTLAGVNTFTGGVQVTGGTLELRNNAIGTSAITLGGGTTLQFISSGLLGQFYTGDDGGAHNAFGAPDLPANTFATYTNYFANRAAPTLTVSTDSNGVTALDFQGVPQYGVYNFTQDDNIVSRMSGRIFIPANGSYTFGTSSDDGSMLFIDGQAVVSNNVYQGRTRRTGSVTLTEGLHNIDIGFYEGGVGNSLTVDWAGPGFGTQNLPNSVLENNVTPYDGVANTINMTGSATFDLRGGTANLGQLTQTVGTTLTATAGLVSFTDAILPGGTYNYAGAGSVLLNQITDGGNAVTINRSGGGNLVLPVPINAQLQNPGSSLNVSGGSLVVAIGAVGALNNPLGVAPININGGGLGLSSSDGAVSFSPVLNITGNAIVSGGNFGGNAVDTQQVTLTRPLSIGAGNTLTVNTNSGYTLDLAGGVSGAGSVAATGGDVVSSTSLNVGGSVSVTGGTLTTVGTFNAASANVTNGTLRSLGAPINATTGTVIGPGGTVELNGSNNTGGGFNLQGGTLRAASGINDLLGGTINVAPVGQTPGILRGLAYSGFTGPPGGFGSELGLFETLNRVPTAQVNLTGSLNFGPRFGADGAFNAFFGTTLADAFTAAFTGKFTANATGDFTFGQSINDDGASIWLDRNQNGLFERAGSLGDERVTNQDGCCGNSDNPNDTTNGIVSLVTGQSYDIAIILQDTGGGSSLASRFDPGAIPGSGGLSQFINPGAQVGFFSADAANTGGLIRVDSAAELRAGAIINGQSIRLGGSGAKLTLAGPGASDAEQLSTESATGASELSASGTAVNLDALVVTDGTSLLKSGTADLNLGGLVIGSGATLTLASSAGAGPAAVQAVPEPGSLAMLATGVLGLLGRRRRR